MSNQKPEILIQPDLSRKPASVFQGYYLLTDCSEDIAKNSNSFVRYTIMDRSGKLTASEFNRINEVLSCQNQAVFLEMEPRGDYFNIISIRPAAPNEYSPDLLIPRAPEEAESMFQELLGFAKSIQNPYLQKIVSFLLEKNHGKLLTLPAAKSMHHDVQSGWLYHVVRMARAANALCPVYPEVNRDLLLAGVIVHDIGKIDEYQINGINGLVDDYTVNGTLLSHNIQGILTLQKAVNQLSAKAPDRKQYAEAFNLLSHMIESHHGKPEFGSAVSPKFLEAELLHQLDMMDSRIWMFNKTQNGLEPGQKTEKKVFGIGTVVYRPNLGN
jgi:3'-5' exoribonuclease